ncbi:MAG: sigma-70 family RNA polymerase sigma factor [Deltaproteobacteria bacterium]|nr:sigma-70 family RNA polymerase sigma factor [Deltaproteobacteria bacterium]
MLEDKILVWKLNRGRKNVLCDIYEKYKHELVTLSAALLSNKDAAEDVVHDVFLRLINANGSLKIKTNLKGYLMTAVANTSRNKNRSAGIRQTVEISDDLIQDDQSVDPEASTIFGEDKNQLISALSQLPYEQKEVILLRVYSRLKFKTIAQTLNESINTVQGRYRYGLEKLRSIFDGAPK